jgi:hypothetical protein
VADGGEQEEEEKQMGQKRIGTRDAPRRRGFSEHTVLAPFILLKKAAIVALGRYESRGRGERGWLLAKVRSDRCATLAWTTI